MCWNTAAVGSQAQDLLALTLGDLVQRLDRRTEILAPRPEQGSETATARPSLAPGGEAQRNSGALGTWRGIQAATTATTSLTKIPRLTTRSIYGI